jgi:hypothetical protein
MYVNLYKTLFMEEENKCKTLYVLPGGTDRVNDKKYRIVLSNKLNCKCVYRRGYPRGSPCEADRTCGAVPSPRHSTQETYLTVYKLYFRYNIKGTASSLLHRYLTTLLPLTEEEVQPGWGLHSATVRIISAVVSFHRRG